MKQIFTTFLAAISIGCTDISLNVVEPTPAHLNLISVTPVVTVPGTWAHFLQHLPMKEGLVVDYRTIPVKDQSKHVTIVDYDIGTTDLQ